MDIFSSSSKGLKKDYLGIPKTNTPSLVATIQFSSPGENLMLLPLKKNLKQMIKK